MLTSHPRVLSAEIAPAPGPGAVTGNTSHREVLSWVTTPASDDAVIEVAGHRVQRELREGGIGPVPATTRVVDALTGQGLNLSDLEGVRADPAKIKVIAEWPVPQSQKDLRRWLGLANCPHRYTANYAEMARPLSDLLKKDSEWVWTPECHPSCVTPPIMPSAVLIQEDEHGRERVISFQSRQLKGAERNYPVHDKALLAMKFA
ncbi:hypothetical protein P43SY_011840 [Pythium insidiosum]|uniref:Reverse transcriptase RNase H-like domain-containing protein n=1 Tax=Pythium insidiosum TaxID=114742 RepID=A0AAD5L7G4_PYTIN|nr:hypothetical protein P43SY_011840 [Pythium insidiosum]